ncbi:unnamed protein product [Sphagnum balticum]
MGMFPVFMNVNPSGTGGNKQDGLNTGGQDTNFGDSTGSDNGGGRDKNRRNKDGRENKNERPNDKREERRERKQERKEKHREEGKGAPLLQNGFLRFRNRRPPVENGRR